MPFTNVSGFAKEARDTEIKNPIDVVPAGCSIGLLLWGSPHRNPSDCSDKRHGSLKQSETHKTESFESMAWLAPNAFVCMAFPDRYPVEFYGPSQSGAHRRLLVDKAYLRDYVPMASSNALRYTIKDVDKDHVMVACLVPPRFWWCLTFVDNHLDLGRTLLNVLSALSPTEQGVSLGCYDLSCEMEIAIACREKECQDITSYIQNRGWEPAQGS
jgi:hypothetical protein